MKKLLILSLISFLFVALSGCTQSEGPTYANNKEKDVIEHMNCWESDRAERLTTLAVLSKDKERSKYFDESFEQVEVAKKEGIKVLCNDTLFINLIRDEALCNNYLKEREELSAGLDEYKSNVTFFARFIDKIKNDIVEYKYYAGAKVNWGLHEYPLKKEHTFGSKFYESYSDLLKEGYSLPENSSVNEEDVLKLNNLLKSIEKLDRKLWAVNYYKRSKEDVEAKDAEKSRKKQTDSLFSK